MTRAGSHLARLEDQAQQQRAADLSGIQVAADAGRGGACPWDDLPPGLPKDTRAAWTWAATMHSRTPAEAWPVPPAGAAQVFEGEAAKVEDPARLTWLVMAKLAQVIGAEA